MASEKYKQLQKEGVADLHNNVLLMACKEDNSILAEFLEENRDFIFSIIQHYKGNVETLKNRFNVTEEELLQHAYIGVITALKDFDFNRGIKFTTYVYRPILWEINQFLYSDSKLVRLSRGAIDLIKRMEQVERDLGEFPTLNELSSLLDVPRDRLEEVLRFASDLAYIEALDCFELEDIDVDHEKEVTDKVYVDTLIKNASLDEFEADIVEMIMSGLNNSQIAEKLDVYPMTINRAIDRIRSKIENDFEDRRTSKYEEEISVIAEEMDELGRVLHIEDIRDLLDVCGFNVSNYTSRILYYIRQKAMQRVSKELNVCLPPHKN